MTLGSAQRHLPLFFPFLESTLAAHAFKISTYKSFNHQFNRLPLRKLLFEISEPRFACRTTKRLFFKAVKENYAAILEKCMECMDGSLQKLGSFARHQLYQAVHHSRQEMTDDIGVINNIYCVELFLNAWGF